jgi:hypothetical protein
MDLLGLEAQVAGADANQPLPRRQMVWLVRLLRAAFSKADARLDRVEGRLGTLETTPVFSMNVVASAGALPAAAGVRQWFRVAGDPAVYVGNGPGRPLTKLTPV